MWMGWASTGLAGPRIKAGAVIEVCWRATDTTRPLAASKEFICTGSVKAAAAGRLGEVTAPLLMGFTKLNVQGWSGGRVWVRAVAGGGDPTDSDTPSVWVPPHGRETFNDHVVRVGKGQLRIYLDIDLPMLTE